MVTGRIPTENPPTKSHDAPRKVERRTLVRTSLDSLEDMPSISSHSLSATTITNPIEQLDEAAILHCKVDRCKDSDGEVKIELYDGVHGIARYTVAINTALEFSIYIFHWPIPDNHAIHLFYKRCQMTMTSNLSLLTQTQISQNIFQEQLFVILYLDY